MAPALIAQAAAEKGGDMAQQIIKGLQTRVARISFNENLDLCSEKDEAYGFNITAGMIAMMGIVGLGAYVTYMRNKFWNENIGKITGMMSEAVSNITKPMGDVADKFGEFGAWIQGK